MKDRRLYRTCVFVLILAATFSASHVHAQVVSITAKSAGHLRDQLRTLIKGMGDNDQVAPALDALSKLDDPMTLKGLDRTKPLGALAYMPQAQEQTPTLTVFIPVTNTLDFIESVKLMGMAVDDKPNIKGFSYKLILPQGQTDFFALTSDGYLFLTTSSANPERTAAIKPQNLRLPGAQGLLANIRLDLIPEGFKQLVLAQLEQNLAPQRERRPGENDPAFKGRLAGMKFVQDGFTTLLREGRGVSLDIDAQSARERFVATLDVDAVDNSPMANALKTFGTRQTIFRDLKHGEAVSLLGVVPVPEAINTLIRDGLKSAREQPNKANDEEGKRVLNLILEAIEPTLKADLIDACMTIEGPFPAAKGKKEPSLVVMFGVGAKGSDKIEAAIREAGAKARPEDREKITFDIAKSAEGVAIHRVKVDPEVLKDNQFGEPVLYLAFPKNAVLIAVGQEGETVLKQTITKLSNASNTSAPQVELDIAAKLVASMNSEDREASEKAASTVFGGKYAESDKLQATLSSQGSRLRLRLEGDLAVLRFFSLVGAARQERVGK